MQLFIAFSGKHPKVIDWNKIKKKKFPFNKITILDAAFTIFGVTLGILAKLTEGVTNKVSIASQFWIHQFQFMVTINEVIQSGMVIHGKIARR